MCPKCRLKLPTSGVGMNYCPYCGTDLRVQHKRTRPKSDPSAAAVARSPSNVGVGGPNSPGGLPVGAERTRHAPGKEGVGATFASPSAHPPVRDIRATHVSEKSAVGHNTQIKETGSGNGNEDEYFDARDVMESMGVEHKPNESEKMTKQQIWETTREEKKKKRRVELRQTQEKKVKREQEKKEERRKELQQRQKASQNPQLMSAVNNPLQSQTGLEEGEDDCSGGTEASGKSMGHGHSVQGGGGGATRGRGSGGNIDTDGRGANSEVTVSLNP